MARIAAMVKKMKERWMRRVVASLVLCGGMAMAGPAFGEQAESSVHEALQNAQEAAQALTDGEEDEPAEDEERAEALADSVVEEAEEGATLRRLERTPTGGEETGEAEVAEERAEGDHEEKLNQIRQFFARISTDEDGTTRFREVGDRLAGATPRHLALQPYVVDPRWNEAMELLSEGDCEDALKLATEVLGPPSVHGDAEPAIRYAFGRMQLCGGQRTAGRATLRSLLEEEGPVAELARRSLGMGSASTPDDDAVALSTRINRARARATEGDVDGALAELLELREGLDSNVDRHHVRLGEARVLEDAGRTEEAAQAYLGVYRMTRWWRSSNRVVSQIEAAEERMGMTIIPFGDRVDRMTDLIARGRYRHAQEVSRENVRIRGVSGDEVRGWTRFRQGLQSERERNRTRAVTQFEEANRLIKDPEVRPRMYFGWARALRRTGGDEEAIELYQQLCEEYPNNHLCPQSLFEAGRLLQYRNRHTEARELFQNVVGIYPFSSHVPDALWLYALSAYLEEDYADAVPALKMLVEFHGDEQDESELTVGLKATYWLGMSYLRQGDEGNARQWLQQAIDEGSLTWYGRLAAIRLEEAGLPARVQVPTVRMTREIIEDFGTLRIPEQERLAAAAELTRLGLYPEALADVRRQQGVHPRPEGVVQLRSALHLALDEPNWAHWIMKSEIQERGPTHRTIRDWGLAFPLNYMELSTQFGEEYGVSPYLVQAIMRQESGFRPEVRSYAGAMGLMQVMPGTARYTARRFLENPSISNRQIMDPETNVRLGTMYIRIHIAHAGDQAPLALAGYNAGPAPLRSWFERFGDREIDAWVESITYRETRGYVRKVMTSYITYQGLYGDGELPRIDLELPEELRSWGVLPEVAEEGEPVSMAW